MSNSRFSRRRLAALALVPLGLGIAASAPAMAANPVIGTASVGIVDYSGHQDVCPKGNASYTPVVNGVWRLQITGGRSDGSSINEAASASGVNTWAPPCVHVNFNGTPTGTFHAVLDYVGAGGDVIAHAERSGGWGTAAVLNVVDIGTP